MRYLTASSLIHAGLLGIALVSGLRLAQRGPGKVHTVVVEPAPQVEVFEEWLEEELREPTETPAPDPEDAADLATEDAPFLEPLPEPLPELPERVLEAPRFGPGFFLARQLRHLQEVGEPRAAKEIAENELVQAGPPQATAEPASARAEPSVLIEAPAPVYPRASIRRGEEGSCVCRLYVGPEGGITRVEIVVSSGYSRLDEAARTALQRWRFRPRTQGGVAVPDELDHTVSFRLE